MVNQRRVMRLSGCCVRKLSAERPTSILRLGGDLLRMDDESSLSNDDISGMLWAIMPEKNRAEFDEKWDTDFAYEITGVSRFRVNVLRERHGVASVIRTIATGTVTVEQLAITPEVQALCNLTKG